VQYTDEKLLNSYADFVGALSRDLDRAKSIDSMIDSYGADAGEDVLAEFKKLEERRHEFRRELSRLDFLIRMLEKDKKLRTMVQSISEARPFMAFAFPPQHRQGDFDERSLKFKMKIGAFNKNLEDFVNAIQRKYSRFFW
jgi:hypothetical protein